MQGQIAGTMASQMATYRFRLVNVFTHQGGALTGNPLCVFENGGGLDSDAMQALALQFNLSETTFILPSAERAAAAVRIFTPNYEMPFAGHPTLGTAHVCRALGLGGDTLRLDLRAGLIAVTAAGNRWTLTAPKATWREIELSRADLGAALGLGASDIGERPLWVNAGREQLIVPLATPDAVRRTAPNPAAFAELHDADGVGMAYVFAMTGSAAANLGGFCLAMNRPLPLSLRISQGEAIRRRSTIFLDVDAERRIRVGGEVCEIGAGTIDIG